MVDAQGDNLVTAQDVSNQTFTTVRLREGYDQRQVDEFLDRVSESLTALTRDRERFNADDMLALAFHGLARRRMRGAPQPGDDVRALAANLRGLADALDAFNNYRPGTFLDTDEIRTLAERDDEG